MAARDKICQYSGIFDYQVCYDSKNHIQVLKRYRPMFRGKPATLFIFENDRERYLRRNPDAQKVNGRWYRWELSRIRPGWEYRKRIKDPYQWAYREYALYVPDVTGTVDGLYFDVATDIMTVIRKMRRLVGRRQLAIKYIDISSREWYNDIGKYLGNDVSNT